MEKLDRQLLERLQNLAMVSIQDENKTLDELNKFLEFVDILDELDLSNIDAVYNPLSQNAPLRPDTPQIDPAIPQKVLGHAPKVIDNFFVVPKIIE